MSTGVLGQSVPWLPSLFIEELPACTLATWKDTVSDSHRLSPCGHSRGWKPSTRNSRTSAFLHPFAPQALPCFFTNMGALTPARLALRTLWKRNEHQPFSGQVSLLNTVQPSLHSVTKHLVRPVVAFVLPTQRDRLPVGCSNGFALSVIRSGLRLESAGSSQHTAESCFSSYGLQVRLRLLSTPPHGDAVTFGYRERASPGGDFHPLIAPARRRTDSGLKIAGMTKADRL